MIFRKGSHKLLAMVKSILLEEIERGNGEFEGTDIDATSISFEKGQYTNVVHMYLHKHYFWFHFNRLGSLGAMV